MTRYAFLEKVNNYCDNPASGNPLWKDISHRCGEVASLSKLLTQRWLPVAPDEIGTESVISNSITRPETPHERHQRFMRTLYFDSIYHAAFVECINYD